MKKKLYASLTLNVTVDDAIDPSKIDEHNRGGGCLAGFLGLTEALAKKGYDVHAFLPISKALVGNEDLKAKTGVTYHRFENLFDEPVPDVFLAYYDMMPFAFIPKSWHNAVKVASHHTYTIFPEMASVMAIKEAHVNTIPSQHAMNHLAEKFGGKWRVLPNGLNPPERQWKPKTGQVLYHTSASRGLHWLIKAWPVIYDNVRNASLVVVGDIEHIMSGAHTFYEPIKASLERDMKAALDTGVVTFKKNLPRNELLDLLATSSAFAFPADTIGPCETFSISVMECLAIGMPVVLSPCDSLTEIYDVPNSPVQISPSPVSFFPHSFTGRVIDVLRNPKLYNSPEAQEKRREFASHYSFSRQAMNLHEIIDDIDLRVEAPA